MKSAISSIQLTKSSPITFSQIRSFATKMQDDDKKNKQDADVYSAKNFNASFISYAEDNEACKNDINSPDCPSVKLPQAVNDYLNSYLALIANNVLTAVVKITSKDENPDYGTIEFGVSVTVVGPVPYAAYKKTYELSPHRDIFIALAEANKLAC